MEKENHSEELIAGVSRLVDLVAYQGGAVVSKTVIDKKAGTITLFSFDKGQGLSEHTAPFDAMVYILDGEVELTLSGKKNLMVEGDMIIMSAGEPHALRATEKFKMMLVMIKS